MYRIAKVMLSLAILAAAVAFASDAWAKGGKGGNKQTPASVFKMKDANGDGFLSKEEFIGKNNVVKGEARFPKFDTNGDGKLSLDEYKKGLKKKK